MKNTLIAIALMFSSTSLIVGCDEQADAEAEETTDFAQPPAEQVEQPELEPAAEPAEPAAFEGDVAEPAAEDLAGDEAAGEAAPAVE